MFHRVNAPASSWQGRVAAGSVRPKVGPPPSPRHDDSVTFLAKIREMYESANYRRVYDDRRRVQPVFNLSLFHRGVCHFFAADYAELANSSSCCVSGCVFGLLHP